MTFRNLPVLVTILCSLSRVWGARPNIFVPVSNATCQPEYAWMNNAEQRSPCLTVAYVIAACVGDTWTQPALPSGWSYNSPNGTTATPCYCSWSCYNLMMACTLCQNPAYTSDITTWPSFSQNCPANYKDEVFPQGYILADNTSIPYWATTNPTTWTSELFDIGLAENYANQNKSDYWPANSNSGSSSGGSGGSTDIGAIVGGTVGGIAGLLLVLVGGIFLYKRRRSQQLHNTDDTTSISHMGTPVTNTHALWTSDTSTVFPQTMENPSLSMSYMTTQPQEIGTGTSILQPPSYSPFPTSSPPTDTGSFITTENTVSGRTRTIPIV